MMEKFRMFSCFAQQEIRRHAVVITGPAYEGQTRLSGAILIMAQKGLGYMQVGGRFPLAHALFPPQAGQIRTECQLLHQYSSLFR